jgi:hypothetical protein
VHPDWNEIDLYLADSGAPCLEIGATEAYLRIAPPDGTDPSTMPGGLALADPSDVWVGRRIILRSGVGVADEPNRAWVVTPVTVEAYNDPLDAAAGTLTRIAWDASEALPFQMPIAHASAYLNVVRSVAGKSVRDTFRIGDDAEFQSRFNTADEYQMRRILELPRTIERDGACSGGLRGRVLRHGLAGTDTQGLAWDGPPGNAIPVMSLVEIDPDLGIPGDIAFDQTPASQQWDFVESILDADAEDRAYTVEHGMWSEVVRFRKPSGDVVLADYSGNAGFTVRFGDRDFGIAPDDGTILQATYLTAPGIDANLPADTVDRLSDPTDASGASGISYADWVTNPFAIRSARAPEGVDRIRMNAPEAYKAILLRAVRSEDYRQILERRDDIQQANATARWTGSWTTDFVAVDPVGSTVLGPGLRAELEAELDCIRQAGRSVCLRDPDYVPIDLKIDVCLDPNVSNSAMIRKIARRLTKGGAAENYFHPDNFTFGTPVLRSDLEAVIQCVDGVRGIESIDVRRRGRHDFEPMPARVDAAPHQILQLSNDPARPERGHVEISVHGGG